MPRQRHSILPASCIADVSTASTSIHSGDSHWHSFFFSSPSNYITRLRASRGGFFFHYLSYTSTHFHPLFFVRSFSFALSHYTFIFNVLCSCTCSFIFFSRTLTYRLKYACTICMLTCGFALLPSLILCRPPGAWLRLASYNCGLTHIEIRATGNVSVYGFGDVGFLPLEKVTYH